MSFPLNSNQAYIKDTGERSTLGKEISSSTSIPTYGAEDAGKVLTVGEDGSLEWDEKGGAGGVYVGTDNPSSDVGSNGDYYYKRTLVSNGITSNPLNPVGSNTNGYGIVYKAKKNIKIVGLRGMCTSSKNGTLSIGDTTEATETSESLSFTAYTWATYTLQTPVELSANDEVFVRLKTTQSTGAIAYAPGVIFDSNLIEYKTQYYGSTYPGTEETNTEHPFIDLIIEDDVYKVSGQYYKDNNTWSQIG